MKSIAYTQTNKKFIFGKKIVDIDTKNWKMVQTRSQINPTRPSINYSGMDHPGRRPRMENQIRSLEIPIWMPVVFLGGLTVIIAIFYHFVC